MKTPKYCDVYYPCPKGNEVAALVHTGGTTGVPKTVKLSNANFNAMAIQYKSLNTGYDKGDSFLNGIVPFVAYGIVVTIHMPMCLGLTNIIAPILSPKEFTDYMIKYKPNHTITVPTYVEDFIKNEKAKAMNWKNIKHLGVGGDSFSEESELEVNKFLQEHNSTAIAEKGYGMTENSSTAGVCLVGINKLQSLGIPLPLNTYGIFEKGTDKELKYGVDGEICITGPCKMLGYLNNPEEEKKVIKKSNTSEEIYVKEAILDSYKRLIFPSVEREIRSELKETAEITAIDNFSKNVENLLLTPPMKGKTVLGYDPAFRTGCKLAVLDSTGKPLKIEVIYPTEPHNKIEESKKIVLDLIDKYNIDIIAIGNGTASRESEAFIADCIKDAKRKVEYIIVSEAGASVYSASKLAISEFPDLTVEKRSAISIGRRLQDSLSELVKIDPKSIGVGLYQHDVTPKKLDESLNFVVTKVVNQVGVNVNTASSSLLSYVSGMTKKSIDAILNERDLKGKFTSREEIKKLKGITPKVYEQAIGFIRIPDGVNPLDKTSIHPESYEVTKKLLESIGMNLNDIGTDKLKEKLDNIDIDKVCLDIKTDKYTLKDIIDDLEKPGRDLRDNMPKPILKSDVLTLDDLHIGDKLQGTVRNVVDFGVFIDIGLHNDGLAHISKLTNKYIKHPSEVVSVGDIVDCYVIDINKEKEKVSLSLIEI
mgnify:FL=1